MVNRMKWMGVAGVLVWGLTGCGGGGNGDVSNPYAPDTLLTEQNAESVTYNALASAIDVRKFLGFIDETAIAKIRNTPQESETYSCTFGGEMTLHKEKEGGSIVFDGCTEYLISYDDYATMEGKVAWSGANSPVNVDLEGWTVQTDKGLKLSVDSGSVALEYNGGNIDRMRGELSDKAIIPTAYDGVFGVPSGTYEKHQFDFDIKGLSTPIVSVEVDGLVKAPCTLGWMHVRTTKAVYLTEAQPCPLGGVVDVDGAKDSYGDTTFTETTFYDDGTVQLDLNGIQFKVYSDCMQIPDWCQKAKKFGN